MDLLTLLALTVVPAKLKFIARGRTTLAYCIRSAIKRRGSSCYVIGVEVYSRPVTMIQSDATLLGEPWPMVGYLTPCDPHPGSMDLSDLKAYLPPRANRATFC